MKNRIIFSFIILLTLFLSISAISASENVTCDNLTAVDEDFDELSSAEDTSISDEGNKSSTEISASDKTSYVDYQDTFTIKLTSNGTALADKPITIILDNVTYNKTTDSNGEAILDFKLKVGTYQIAYFFDGDGNYTSSNGTSTITVKSEIKTSLNLIDKTNNHCEGVKSVFHLRLVDVYGNPISGKTVKIKVGSKTYSAKTDSNGIAKFYISLKKGENLIYYYFSEDGQYVASSGTSFF